MITAGRVARLSLLKSFTTEEISVLNKILWSGLLALMFAGSGAQAQTAATGAAPRARTQSIPAQFRP